MSPQQLHGEIANKLGVKYLSDAQTSDDSTARAVGIIWGPNRRAFLNLVVKIGSRAKNVFFFVDPGSPNTFLSHEVGCYV